MPSGLGPLIPLILAIVFLWFVVLRPARKRQREAMAVQQTLEVGTAVMLTSGIYGTVLSVGEDTVELAVGGGAVLTVDRRAVAKIDTDTDTDTDAGIGTGTAAADPPSGDAAVDNDDRDA